MLGGELSIAFNVFYLYYVQLFAILLVLMVVCVFYLGIVVVWMGGLDLTVNKVRTDWMTCRA